jgi:hypothetical protein
LPHNGFGFERNSGKGSFFHTINLHRTAVFSTVGCQATSIALTDSNRLSRIKMSYIFDLSIIGRNAMVGVMEWCSKANHEVPNFKHQITNKSQIPILNDQNRFGILNFGHCDLFDICDL